MSPSKTIIISVIAAMLALTAAPAPFAGQVWTKCHITCRCLPGDSIANFTFVIPIDKSPDIGFDSDLACKNYGHKVCLDCCNGLKFSYTYQATSP